jgi:hypothetical protein
VKKQVKGARGAGKYRKSNDLAHGHRLGGEQALQALSLPTPIGDVLEHIPQLKKRRTWLNRYCSLAVLDGRDSKHAKLAE